MVKNHGKWSEQGVPHKGWRCIDVEDLGEFDSVCEMCDTQEIRYVHYMQHSDYEDDDANTWLSRFTVPASENVTVAGYEVETVFVPPLSPNDHAYRRGCQINCVSGHVINSTEGGRQHGYQARTYRRTFI